VVRLSSYKINNVTIVGVLFSLAFVIIYSIRDRFDEPSLASRICQAEVWCLTLSFTLGFGSLFAKTYRVHRLFNSKQLRTRTIHDSFLFGIVGVMVLFDIIVLSTWQETDPLRLEPVAELVKSQNGERVRWVQLSCGSTHRAIFLVVLCVEKCLILFVGAYIAFRVRHVSIPELNDSKWIGFSIYNVTVLFLLMSPIFFLQSSVSRVVALVVVGISILMMAYSVLSLLFLPKIWAVYHSSKGQDDGDGKHSGFVSSNQVAPVNSGNGGSYAGGGAKISVISMSAKPSHLRRTSHDNGSAIDARQMSGRSIHVNTGSGTPTSGHALAGRADSSPNASKTEPSSAGANPAREQARVRELEDLLKKVRGQLQDAREQQRLAKVSTTQNFSSSSSPAGPPSGFARLSSLAKHHLNNGGSSPRSANSAVTESDDHDLDESSPKSAPLHRLPTLGIGRKGLAYLAPMQHDEIRDPDSQASANGGGFGSVVSKSGQAALLASMTANDGRGALLAPPDLAGDLPRRSSDQGDYPIHAVNDSSVHAV